MKKNTKNNKGFILIACYMIIAVLIIIATGFATTSLGEQRVIEKQKNLLQAFWLAEAGMDKAISDLTQTSITDTSLGQGAYNCQISLINSTPQYLITSTGGIPGTDSANPANTIRSITAIVEQLSTSPDPSGVTAAITANGEVEVRGSAEVNGDIEDNAVFDFQDIFSISKETMEDNATHVYNNPSNNITPVDSVTWINIDDGNELTISAGGWTGSGILIVNGDLKITGGHWTGVLWVSGTLRVSGNPIIDGAIFVESGAEFETTITGNPTVNYDSTTVADAFTYIPSNLPPQIISWKEN